jgi:hypothetical protein
MSTSPVYLHPVTYASNNNVEDPTCHDGYHRPGLNSDTLDQTATLRDVEEAKAHFPTPKPGRLSNDSTLGPITLEVSGRQLGGRLVGLSVHMTEEEERAARPANGTPYPNIMSLFGEDSSNDNADIQCGRCDNPIDYCHCDVLSIPPSVFVPTDPSMQNSEETAVPMTKATSETDEEGRQPVEVRVE